MDTVTCDQLQEGLQQPGKPKGTESSNTYSSPIEKMRVRMAAETYKVLQTNSSSDSEAEDTESHRMKKESKPCARSEKQLTLVIGVAISIIVILSILLVLQHYQLGQNEEKIKQNCLSEKCVVVAGSMLAKMDLNTKPCDNFYQYSCGRTINDPLIPPDKAKWNVFSALYRRNEAILKRVLDAPGFTYKGKTSSAIRKSKQFFAACMNTTATESTSVDVLKKMIKEGGSWSVISDEVAGTWNQATWSLEKSFIYTGNKGEFGLFDFGVVADDKNSNITKITFVQSGLSFGDYSSYLSNETSTKNVYISYFVEVVGLLGGNENLTKTANDLWDFEYRLAQIFTKAEQLTDPRKNYNPMTLQHFQQTLINDVINVEEIMESFFGEHIPLTEQILVPTPDYFVKMAELVKNADPRVLSNYMMWKFVQSFVQYMPTPFRLARQRVTSALYGTTAPQPWVTCVSRTSSVLGFAAGALYVEKAFAEESKETVEMIMRDIRQTFKDNLPLISWMDNDTKLKALEKAEGVTQKVAYPSFIMDPAELDTYYENLTVLENEPFQNILKARQYGFNKAIAKRGKPPDKSRWSMAPATVNAYYSADKNEIVFPAGILQDPFFNPDAPMAVNYGGIGLIVGHELTHGFDSSGAQYDVYGNMNNWWTNSSFTEFEKRTHCLVDQYNKYAVYDSHVNGLLTLGENIADNGGIKTAYKAYQNWLDRNDGVDPNSLLPGLNMTTDQLFFLGFGQVWCAHYTHEYAIRSLSVDPHSYAKYRVIGSLSNFPKFSEAYNCPVGSLMNPEKKCSVW